MTWPQQNAKSSRVLTIGPGRVSENVFEVLPAKLGIGVFNSAVHWSPENISMVTLACLALQNVFLSKRDSVYAPATLVYREQPFTHDLVNGKWHENQNYMSA